MRWFVRLFDKAILYIMQSANNTNHNNFDTLRMALMDRSKNSGAQNKAMWDLTHNIHILRFPENSTAHIEVYYLNSYRTNSEQLIDHCTILVLKLIYIN